MKSYRVIVLTAVIWSAASSVAPARAQESSVVDVIFACDFDEAEGGYTAALVQSSDPALVRGVEPGQRCVDALAKLVGRFAALRQAGGSESSGPVLRRPRRRRQRRKNTGMRHWGFDSNTVSRPALLPSPKPALVGILTCQPGGEGPVVLAADLQPRRVRSRCRGRHALCRGGGRAVAPLSRLDRAAEDGSQADQADSADRVIVREWGRRRRSGQSSLLLRRCVHLIVPYGVHMDATRLVSRRWLPIAALAVCVTVPTTANAKSSTSDAPEIPPACREDPTPTNCCSPGQTQTLGTPVADHLFPPFDPTPALRLHLGRCRSHFDRQRRRFRRRRRRRRRRLRRRRTQRRSRSGPPMICMFGAIGDDAAVGGTATTSSSAVPMMMSYSAAAVATS